MAKVMTTDELRLALCDFCEDHEFVGHGGDACWRERINIIAFLAHGIHLGPEHAKVLSERMAHYDQECPCREPGVDRGQFDVKGGCS
jgi:hypothetical protein